MKFSTARKQMLKIINELESQCMDYFEQGRASANTPTWIPCSERMPEYRKTVLISTLYGVKTGFLDGTEAYGDFWEIIEDDATAALHSIYAWMPLPEPWKVTDDE